MGWKSKKKLQKLFILSKLITILIFTKCFTSIYPNATSPFILCKQDIIHQLAQSSILDISIQNEFMIATIDSVDFKLSSKVSIKHSQKKKRFFF